MHSNFCYQYLISLIFNHFLYDMMCIIKSTKIVNIYKNEIIEAHTFLSIVHIRRSRNLCSKIISSKDSGKNEGIGEQLTELCKLLIWGDRYDSDFFEHFFQIKALDRLLQIFSKTNSKEVVIAIISFFSNLLSNLSKNQNVNYLLSHPCLISLQNIKFFSLDNQIAQYYINFLNTVSQKIDLNSLHIFFNRRYPSFPLLMQTTRFYNHPQSLVRTKSRSILLSCLKLDSPKVKQFASGFPFVTYYIHQCNLLKEYWLIVDEILELEGDKQFQLNNLQSILEDQKQLIMIMDDFMKIDPIKVAACFVNAFANQCMAPLLQALYSLKKQTFNIKIVVLIAWYIVSNVHNQQFVDFVIFAFFGKYYSSTLCVKLMHPVEKPLSYSKKWKFKGFWDSYQNNINQYCTVTYFPNDKKIISDIYADVVEQKKSQVTERKYTSQMRSIFGMGTNFYDRQTQKLQQIFAIPIHSDAATFQRKSVYQLLAELKGKIKNNQLNLNELQENPARQPLLSFLKSKDDTLVMLILNLISSVINNKYVSAQVLQFAALSTKPRNYDFKSLFDIQQIMKCCFGLMEVEPPAFRICTYKQAASIIEKLSQIYQGNIEKIPIDLILIAKLALRRSIERLNPYIYAGKDWEKSLNTFNNVSSENDKYRRKDLYAFGLLQKEPSQVNKLQNFQVYNIHPKTAQQIQARDFWLYVIVRDSYCKLLGLPIKFPVKSCDQKAEKNASNFEVGSKYEIQQDHEIPAGYKQMSEKYYADCSLIFLGGYFIIGVNKMVRFKSSYQDCLMVMDRSDASKIIVQIDKKVISVQVQNAKKGYQLRKHFQQMKTLMFKYQLSLLVKQTQWMLEQAKPKIV